MLFGSNVALLFMSRDLGFEPVTIGTVLSGLGIGGLIGAAVAGPLTKSLGPGLTIAGSLAIWALGFGGLALVYESASAPLAAAVLMGLVGTINPIPAPMFRRCARR